MRTIKAETYGLQDEFVDTEENVLSILRHTPGVVIHDAVQFRDQYDMPRTAVAVSMSDKTRQYLYIEHGIKFARDWNSWESFNTPHYACFCK